MANKSKKNFSPKEVLEQSQPLFVLLIEDNEITLRERFLKKYIEKFCVEGSRTTEIFDGRSFGEKDLKKFEESALSLSLFTEQKIIVFNSIDNLSASLMQKLIEVVKAKPLSTNFVFSGTVLPEKSVFKRKVQELGQVITFLSPSVPELKRFILREFKAFGIQDISEDAIELVSKVSNQSIDAAAKIVRLVGLYVEGAKVTAADVNQVIKFMPAVDTFKFIDSLVQQESSKLTLSLQSLLDSGGNIFGLITLGSKNAFQILAWNTAESEHYGAARLKTEIGLTPWIANKIALNSKKVSIPAANNTLKKLLQADIRLKSRSVRPVDILQGVIDR